MKASLYCFLKYKYVLLEERKRELVPDVALVTPDTPVPAVTRLHLWSHQSHQLLQSDDYAIIQSHDRVIAQSAVMVAVFPIFSTTLQDITIPVHNPILSHHQELSPHTEYGYDRIQSFTPLFLVPVKAGERRTGVSI